MINYPGKKKVYGNGQVYSLASRRGMSLEEDINVSNAYYREKEIAVVHKKPTPIQIVHVDYPSRNKAKITEAYFKQPSTTDYQGVYKGYCLDFEAKETKNKTLFPLSLLHQHQLNHLRQVSRHGALSFLIIRFTSLEKTYLVLATDMITYIDSHSSRSLPITWIDKNAIILSGNLKIPCDYIGGLETMMKGKKL